MSVNFLEEWAKHTIAVISGICKADSTRANHAALAH